MFPWRNYCFGQSLLRRFYPDAKTFCRYGSAFYVGLVSVWVTRGNVAGSALKLVTPALCCKIRLPSRVRSMLQWCVAEHLPRVTMDTFGALKSNNKVSESDFFFLVLIARIWTWIEGTGCPLFWRPGRGGVPHLSEEALCSESRSSGLWSRSQP